MEKIRNLFDKYVKNDIKSSDYSEREYKAFPFKSIDNWDKSTLKKLYFKFEGKDKIRKFARIVSLMGDPRLWIPTLITLGFYSIFTLDFSILTVFFTGFFQSYLIYYIIKNKIKRARPFVEFKGEIINLDSTGHGYSFPSGHSHHSTILLGLILFYTISNPLISIPILLIYNILIPLSRLISGVHYPSDVIFAIFESYLELILHWFVTKTFYLFLLNIGINLINLI